MEKGQMLPYLDNEFLSVTRTRQDSKEIIFDCLSFLVNIFEKTLKKKYKFTILAVFVFAISLNFWKKKRKEMSHLTTCRRLSYT